MSLTLGLFIAVILLAFVFGLTNGFIDGGGLVSTVITTRALEPMWALLLVAAGELAGLYLLGDAVAHKLAKQLIVLPDSAPPLSGMRRGTKLTPPRSLSSVLSASSMAASTVSQSG